MTTSIDKLTNQLASAAQGSRELDAEIARFLGWTTHTDEDDPVYVNTITTWWNAPGEEWDEAGPSFFTTSLDAALTIKPSAASYYVASDELSCHACVWLGEPRISGGATGAATDILALCIAALKARAALAALEPIPIKGLKA